MAKGGCDAGNTRRRDATDDASVGLKKASEMCAALVAAAGRERKAEKKGVRTSSQMRKEGGEEGEDARVVMKILYDVMVAHTGGDLWRSAGLLPSLCVGKEFDVEQVWGQLDEATEVILRRARRGLYRPLPKLLIEAMQKGNGMRGRRKEDENESEGESEEEESEEEDEEEEEEEKEEKGRTKSRRKGMEGDEEDTELLPGEDRFLRYADMERFVNEAEEEEENKEEAAARSHGVGDDFEDSDDLAGSDEEEGLQFGDGDGEEEEEEEEALLRAALASHSGGKEVKKKMAENGKGGKSILDKAGSGAMYNDFFGGVAAQPAASDDSPSDEEEDSEEEKDEFIEEEEELQGSESEEEARDDDDDDVPLPSSKQSMSRAERVANALANQARELEAENIGEKAWEYRGEVVGKSRPKNSALEVDIEFEHAQRPAPVITEEVTATLEDIIRQRILERRFDDPIRIQVSAGGRKNRAEDFQLDEEKSKKGLGEIYADAYQEEAAKAAENGGGAALAGGDQYEGIRGEARGLYKDIMYRLDALAHFQAAPRAPLEQLTVRADAPALLMEEAVPGLFGDANMLAPEEVFKGGKQRGGVKVKEEGRKEEEEEEEEGEGEERPHLSLSSQGSAAGGLKAEEELSREDRKRRRAKRKRKSSAVHGGREREMAMDALLPKSNKTKRNPNVVVAAEGGKSMGSSGKRSNYGKSAAVFERIQENEEKRTARKLEK